MSEVLMDGWSGAEFRNGVFQNYMEKGGKRGRTGFGVICTWNFWSFCDGEWSSYVFTAAGLV